MDDVIDGIDAARLERPVPGAVEGIRDRIVMLTVVVSLAMSTFIVVAGVGRTTDLAFLGPTGNSVRGLH